MPSVCLSPDQALSVKDAYKAEDEVDDAAEDASDASTANLGPHHESPRAERVCRVPDQALSMKDTYEAEDEVDDAAEDASDAQQRRVRSAALTTGGPLPDDQGMFFPARAYWGAAPGV